MSVYERQTLIPLRAMRYHPELCARTFRGALGDAHYTDALAASRELDRLLTPQELAGMRHDEPSETAHAAARVARAANGVYHATMAVRWAARTRARIVWVGGGWAAVRAALLAALGGRDISMRRISLPCDPGSSHWVDIRLFDGRAWKAGDDLWDALDAPPSTGRTVLLWRDGNQDRPTGSGPVWAARRRMWLHGM